MPSFRTPALLRALSAATAALALACGGGSSGNNNNAPATPDPAFFGLADKRCWFLDDEGGNADYTVEILADDTSINNVHAWHLMHRTNGFVTLEQWLEVTATALVEHRRQTIDRTIGGQTLLYRYTPAPPLLRKDMADGDALDNQVTTVIDPSGGAEQTVKQDFRTNATATDTPFQAGGQSVTPLQLLLTTDTLDAAGATTATSVDKAWFLAQTGFVRLHLSIDPNHTYTLDHVAPDTKGACQP
jgi:hypothetical protein